MVSANASYESFQSTGSAQSEFRGLVMRAFFQSVLNRIIGRPIQLCSFGEVRRKVGPSVTGLKKLREIDLNHVTGSVGRYSDYTLGFLPHHLSDEDRWVRVKQVVNGTGGLPAIEVFQLGDDYYVEDGHHRVSVLKQLGVRHVEAWVTEVHPVGLY